MRMTQRRATNLVSTDPSDSEGYNVLDEFNWSDEFNSFHTTHFFRI